MYVGRVGIKGVVGVIGGSDASFVDGPLAGQQERILSQAKELGRRLGELQSAHLLTDGGSGVMKAVSEGFYSVHPRGGIILAIIAKDATPEECPNAFVEIPIRTHLKAGEATADSASHIFTSTADVIVALPGGEETLSLLEVATKAKYKYSRPALIYLPDSSDSIAGKNAAALKRGKYTTAETVEEVVAFVENCLSERA